MSLFFGKKKPAPNVPAPQVQQQQQQQMPMQQQQQVQYQEICQDVDDDSFANCNLNMNCMPPIQLMSNNIGSYGRSNVNAGSVPRRLPTKDFNPDFPLCSVILTVNTGSSYDPLFVEVPQEPPEAGVAISLWQLHYTHLDKLYIALVEQEERKKQLAEGNARPEGQAEGKEGEVRAVEGKPASFSTPKEPPKSEQAAFEEILWDMNRAEPDSILLNFECCGGCSDSGFPVPAAVVMKLVRHFLDRTHSVQFGDFSTKALTQAWDTDLLGPNPLRLSGTLSNHFDLKFNPVDLIGSPSAQLNAVGELCREKGGCHVHAMGSTCRFYIDKAATDTPAYQLQVLTVMTQSDGAPCPEKETVQFLNDKFKGLAGHVAIRFPARAAPPPKAKAANDQKDQDKSMEPPSGWMYISAGHWIELKRIDTNFESMHRVWMDNYGVAEAQRMKDEYSSLDTPAEQEAYVQTNAQRFVQSRAPTKYSNLSKSKSPYQN